MTQLALPIPIEPDPRRVEACRKLARLVRRTKSSFRVQDYARRREAMLKVTRTNPIQPRGE